MAIDISHTWTKNAEFILQYAKKQNDEGRTFPVWGTCLGHQLLSYLTANFDSKAIQSVDDEAPKINTLQILKNDSQIFTNWQSKHF